MDRRVDIGGKAVGAVLSAIVTIIMCITWYEAKGASIKSQKNETELARASEQLKNIDKKVDTIQEDLKKLLYRNGINPSSQ